MVHYSIQNLKDIKALLSTLSDEHYDLKLKTLMGATIGQHIRHVLEFYGCLIVGHNAGIINYDSRQRNLSLERSVKAALEVIAQLMESLAVLTKDCPLILEGNYGDEESGNTCIATTLYRELAYNLEHSIHHQALIKIGLMELKLTHLIDPCFGVAPATIRFNQATPTAVSK